jgi:ABC-type hemin transport system ATPase subunit
VIIANNPCFINLQTSNVQFQSEKNLYDKFSTALKDTGVSAFCGPNWKTNAAGGDSDLKKLCTAIGQTVGSCHYDNRCENPKYPKPEPESVLSDLHDY